MTTINLIQHAKRCNLCKVLKSTSAFTRRRPEREPRISRCRPCAVVKQKEYSGKDRGAYLTRRRDYRNSRKDVINALQRPMGYVRHLKLQFGISIDQYEHMLIRQNSKCAICEMPETKADKRYGKVRRLSVDHNHTSGEIRGLLCFECNTALGKFKDNTALLRRAACYLEGGL